MKECFNCRYHAHDMEDSFCVHPKANRPFGTDLNAMRGTKKPKHAAEACGPDAKFFEERKNK